MSRKDFIFTVSACVLISGGCFLLGMAWMEALTICSDMVVGEQLSCTYLGDGAVECEMRR